MLKRFVHIRPRTTSGPSAAALHRSESFPGRLQKIRQKKNSYMATGAPSASRNAKYIPCDAAVWHLYFSNCWKRVLLISHDMVATFNGWSCQVCDILLHIILIWNFISLFRAPITIIPITLMRQVMRSPPFVRPSVRPSVRPFVSTLSSTDFKQFVLLTKFGQFFTALLKKN